MRDGGLIISVMPGIVWCVPPFVHAAGVRATLSLKPEESGRKLDRAIEVHTVELRKFQFDETTISNATPLAQWSWLILNAQDYSADNLRRLFPDLSFQRAIGCLETISSITKDKAMHDQREKAQRDYDWMLSNARQQGIEEGREVGREEGVERGTVIGAIQSLQQIMGDEISGTPELYPEAISELQTRLAELQVRARSRFG